MVDPSPAPKGTPLGPQIGPVIDPKTNRILKTVQDGSKRVQDDPTKIIGKTHGVNNANNPIPNESIINEINPDSIASSSMLLDVVNSSAGISLNSFLIYAITFLLLTFIHG